MAISNAMSIIFRAYIPIQLVPSALFKLHLSRQFTAPVELVPILSRPRNPLEHIVSIGIFPVDPPGKINQEFLKYSFQEIDIVSACFSPASRSRYTASAAQAWTGGFTSLKSPSHKQVTAHQEFHIPFPHDQQELIFCKYRIHQTHWNTLKCHIPGSIPGIFRIYRASQ